MRADGLVEYGWYRFARAWEISQAYEVFRGDLYVSRFKTRLTREIISQHQMSIVQDRRQQDGIATTRLDRKSTEALWKDGGEREGGSPTYLRIVGRKKEL